VADKESANKKSGIKVRKYIGAAFVFLKHFEKVSYVIYTGNYN